MVSFACFGTFDSQAFLIYVCMLSVIAIIPVSLLAVFLENTMDIPLRRALSVEAVAISIVGVLCAIFFGWFTLIFVLPGVFRANAL